MSVSPAKRIMRSALCLVVAFPSLAPAFAQEKEPYFRFKAGQVDAGGETEQGITVTGPTGEYVVRIGRALTLGSPSASADPVTWTASGPYPRGLGVDPISGVVSGRPEVAGRFAGLAVTAHAPRKGGGETTATSKTFAVTVLDLPISVSYASSTASANSLFLLAPVVRNVSSQAEYRLTGTLPTGLTMSRSTGVIQGTATGAAGATGLVVTVRDVDGEEQSSAPFSIGVSQVQASLNINSDPTGIQDFPYTNKITYRGLTAPVRYEVAPSSGRLPLGITAAGSPTDSLTGRATESGTFGNIVVIATDANNVSVPSQPFSLTFGKPAISYPSTQQVVGKGFAIPPVLANINGARFAGVPPMPDGLTVDPATGVVSGRLQQTGPATFQVSATNEGGTYVSKAATVTGYAESYTVRAQSTFVQAHVGYPVDTGFTATSLATPVSWALSGSALPDGLVLGKASGRITGTSYAASHITGVSVQAVDSTRTAVESEDVTFQILALPSLPAAETYAAPLNRAWQNRFSARNLIGAGSYAMADEALLPPGLKLAPDGLLSGTPTVPGTYPGIVVTVVDGRDGASGRSAPFTMTVRDVGTDLAVDNVAGLYRVRQSKPLAMPAPMALNATAPATWSLAPESAPLPAGLSVDPATGSVVGTPTVVGTTSSLRLKLTDASGRPPAISPYFAIEVAPPLQVADVSSSYAIRIAGNVEVLPKAIGRLGDATWELSGGVLPQALAFDPRLGRIAGAPLVSGRIPFTPPALRSNALAASSTSSTSSTASPGYVLKVTDSFDGAVATSEPFDFVVGSGIVIASPSSYKAAVGLDFTTSGTYTVKGAEGQLAWSLVSGTLPDGLRLDGRTGVIAGTPTAASIAYGLRLQATDMSNDVSGTSAPFTISVSGGLQPRAPALAYAHVNIPYAYLKPTVTGNQGAVRWSIAAGGLPPGLKLDAATGWVSGTPLNAGTFTNIRLGASDASGQVGVTSEITFVVNDKPTWASKAIVIPNARYDTMVGPYPAPTINGAVGKVTFSKPAGRWSVWGSQEDFNIDPDTGVITGKVTGKAYNGDFMYEGWMVATDETGAVANAPMTDIFSGIRPLSFGDCDFFNGDGVCWTNARPSIESVVSVGYTGGVLGALRYSFVPGKEPPDWVKLDPVTGFVHGTPPAAGDYPYSMRVTDVDGATADRKRAFHVITFDRPTDTPERVTLDVRYGAYKVFDPIVPTVTDPAGGTVRWDAWGGYEFPMQTVPNGGSLKAIWNGGYRYGVGVGTIPGYTVRATGSDGTVLSTTAVTLNVMPELTIGNATNVCVRYGDTFDTGPRVAGNVYGTARWESWWNSSPYTLRGSFINFDAATGRVSGTAPNSEYDDYFEPRLFDTYDNAAAYAPSSRQYIQVYAPLSLAPPDNVIVRERAEYSTRMRNSGGTWNSTFYVVDPAKLPPGVFMDRNGYFGGTATKEGTYTFRVGFTPRTCGAPDLFTNVTVTVLPAGLPYLQAPDTMYFREGLLSRSPDPKVVGQGTENYAWGPFGALPGGLGVDAGSGAVYGVPTKSGIFDYQRIGATNTRTNYGLISNYIKVVVLAPPVVTMPAATTLALGQPTRIAPTASGFVGSVGWTGTPMPPGLSVNPADGSVTGVPTATGTTSNLAVRGSETGSAGLDTAGNPVPAAGMTSNAFAITVVAKPIIQGVADMTGLVNQTLTMQPTGVAVGPSPVWSIYGEAPAGFSIDPATGKVSGSSPIPVTASLSLAVTDTVTGFVGTSGRFRITVNPPARPALPTTWTWDRQICTYNSAVGEFAGRQLQSCSGDDCPTATRGCKVPYAGGESSFPIGLTATECQDPTLPPNEGYCPGNVGGDPKGKWLYSPVDTQPNPNSCITVTEYRLGCFVDGNASPQTDTSTCGPAPTNTAECKLNDKDYGTCATGIGFTDGRNMQGFDDGSKWYTTNYCTESDGILLDVLWVTSVNGVEVAVVREPGSDYAGPYLHRGWFDTVGAAYKVETVTRNVLVYTLFGGSGSSQYVTRPVPAIRATRAAIDKVYALAKQYTFQDVHGPYDGGAADIHNSDTSAFAFSVRTLGAGVHGPARGVGTYGLMRCVSGSICVHETAPAQTGGPGPQSPAWKYATNGHVENTCTAGASVYELVPGCYVGDRLVDAGQCPQAPNTPPWPSCKVWPKNVSTVGVEGNCPTGYPQLGLPFAQQQVEYASVGFMYDYKGTCNRSEITPYR